MIFTRSEDQEYSYSIQHNIYTYKYANELYYKSCLYNFTNYETTVVSW